MQGTILVGALQAYAEAFSQRSDLPLADKTVSELLHRGSALKGSYQFGVAFREVRLGPAPKTLLVRGEHDKRPTSLVLQSVKT